MNRIVIDFIPVEKMRYPTVGDYFYDENGVLNIQVADLGDEYENRLVALHEFIEEALTKKRGITEQQIMDFDLMFEKEREEGKHTDDEEPGWDKRSPYRNEHIFAEDIERFVCQELDIDWALYNDKVMNL